MWAELAGGQKAAASRATEHLLALLIGFGAAHPVSSLLMEKVLATDGMTMGTEHTLVLTLFTLKHLAQGVSSMTLCTKKGSKQTNGWIDGWTEGSCRETCLAHLS